MSSVSARNAVDTLPIKVFFRDGSHATLKLGALANFGELHKAVVMKVRGTKVKLKDNDPLLRFFALYTVTSESYIGTFFYILIPALIFCSLSLASFTLKAEFLDFCNKSTNARPICLLFASVCASFLTLSQLCPNLQ